MKKILLGLALLGFVAGTALTATAFDKNKDKKSCCSKKDKKSCEGKDEKSCDKKDKDGKKSCCSKKSEAKSTETKSETTTTPAEGSK